MFIKSYLEEKNLIISRLVTVSVKIEPFHVLFLLQDFVSCKYFIEAQIKKNFKKVLVVYIYY